MKKTSVILIIICISGIYFNPVNHESIQAHASQYDSTKVLNNIPQFEITQKTISVSIKNDSYSEIETNIRDSILAEDIRKPSEQFNIKSEYSFQNYNYVIISTMDLYDEILSSDFINWKQKIGYNIRIVNVTDSEIQEQNGHDLAEKIRNFLREYYLEWGIQYVLLIGDHDTIPMRYCYPDPTNHKFQPFEMSGGEHQTDYYYADLSLPDSESWDFDGDGYYGEYGDDFPDFEAEVYVGRIPTSNASRIEYTLDKIVSYEQDTGEWKNNVLNAASFFYFENQYNLGYPEIDAARCLGFIDSHCMNDCIMSRYSEQEGIVRSSYDWNPISEESFTEDWRNGKYGIVNWGGHGAPYVVVRTVWEKDDGDNIPEANEISSPSLISINSHLDDDYPSIVCALSCMVGCLEENPYGILSVDLLTKPSFGAAVGILCNTRIFYATDTWPNPQGGMESILYHFYNNLLINHQRLGDAFYNSKYFCNQQYGWPRYTEYINLYIINLYGDPSLVYLGISPEGRPEKPATPMGPNSGKIDEEHTYVSSTIDPNNDTLYYFFEWGDGTNSGWLGPYASGVECSATHSWNKKGNYEVKVRARDSNGCYSEWSEPLPVSMPRTYIRPVFLMFFEKIFNWRNLIDSFDFENRYDVR